MNQRKFLTSILSAIAFVSPAAAFATPASAEALPKQYQAAKSNLGADYYTVYRVVEKLSRANNLIDNAWNVRLTESYAMNSFADGANLIAIPKSELQKLSSDVDAMACMVAREMSHHIRKHKAIGPQELQALKQTIANCPASTPLAVSRQPSWPARGSDRPLFVAGDKQGAMALEAIRKLSHRPVSSIAITGLL